MTLLQARHLLDAVGITAIHSLGLLLWPVAAALLAKRRGRPILLWTTLTFFMPLVAPFAIIPFCSCWRVLCGGYGVPTDVIRLLAGPVWPLFLWARPSIAAPREPPARGRGRDLAIALAFLAFLMLALFVLGVMFFPAQH